MKIALTIVMSLSVIAAGVSLAADPAGTDAQSKIRSLQNDLIATWHEAVEVAAAARMGARMSALEALQIQRSLLDATLDSAATRQERISVLEGIVELEKKIETVAEVEHRNAKVAYIEVPRAKAARIKAEIALEKEKANGGR